MVKAVPGRTETLEALRRNADAIKRQGATALFLFGSAARDDLRDDSDVDVFIDFDRDSEFDLISLAGLQLHLQKVLGRDVDVSTRGGLHPLLRDEIERSCIQVF